jgi:hypothetical protein
MVYEFIWTMEYVARVLAPEPHPGGRFIRIYDLKGVGLLDMADREAVAVGQVRRRAVRAASAQRPPHLPGMHIAQRALVTC